MGETTKKAIKASKYVFIAIITLINLIGFLKIFFEIQVVYSTISYQDLISIILTAVTVLLAVLAIGLGIFAFFGYDVLKKSLHEVAIKTAKETAETTSREVSQSNFDKILSATNQVQQTINKDVKNNSINALEDED